MEQSSISLELKSKILSECKQLLDLKLKELQSVLADVTEATNTETKSTAGDKHETGRAMMQIEQEKISKQLSDLKNQLDELEKIPVVKHNVISTGALVETDSGVFYIATAIGKMIVDRKEVFVISPQSPVGKQLIGSDGNSFKINDKKYSIKFVI